MDYTPWPIRPRRAGKRTELEEEQLLLKISKLRTAIMKDEFVFTMAMSQLGKPGARTRAVNAARRLDAIIKEYQ